MFVVELAFDGNPERLKHRPAHRQRLEELRDAGRLVMAGPFADDAGALLIFSVDTEAELSALLDDDPYYGAPGVNVVRTQEWSPIVSV